MMDTTLIQKIGKWLTSRHKTDLRVRGRRPPPPPALFALEPLDPRVLLSAGPLFAALDAPPPDSYNQCEVVCEAGLFENTHDSYGDVSTSGNEHSPQIPEDDHHGERDATTAFESPDTASDALPVETPLTENNSDNLGSLLHLQSSDGGHSLSAEHADIHNGISERSDDNLQPIEYAFTDGARAPPSPIEPPFCDVDSSTMNTDIHCILQLHSQAENSSFNIPTGTQETVDQYQGLASQDVDAADKTADFSESRDETDQPPVAVSGDAYGLSIALALNETQQIVSQELVFIDSGTPDTQQLIDDLLAHPSDNRQIDVVVLDGNQNGIEQISHVLDSYDALDAVHIVSHGSDGAVQLGSSWLDLRLLDVYAEQIVGWRDAFSDHADLLFYGCDLAKGQDGQALLAGIRELTGADVAASDDDTGHALLGGDWDLEYQMGVIETDVTLSQEGQSHWMGLLDLADNSSGSATIDYLSAELAFEVNDGQTDGRVDFLARGSGYSVFLTEGDAVLVLNPGDAEQVVRLNLVGAATPPAVNGEDPLAGRSNYMIGNDPDAWQTDVAHYGSVRYEQVYEGIDLRYYGNQRQLEYDFIVAPGADADQIHLEFDGAQAISIDANGDLVLVLNDQGDDVRFKAPYSYQTAGDGTRNSIASHYQIHADGTVGFELGAYDTHRELTIDPTLDYLTFLGGTGSDSVNDVAVDSSGYAYITGITPSIDFLTTEGALERTLVGYNDAYVTKLSTNGSSLVYSTFIGGDGYDHGNGITVDGSGNAYVVGRTSSTDLPTVNAYQAALSVTSDAFLLKLNASGNALLYASYFGGSGASDSASAVVLDSSGTVYIAGNTNSSNASFPLRNALYGSLTGTQDAFVAKFDLAETGDSSLLYSSYLGSSGSETVYGIDVDSSGNFYVSGTTDSNDLPTVNEYSTYNGGIDIFLSKFNSAGSALLYSSYLGTTGYEYGFGLAVDDSGNAYLGLRVGIGFPTKNAYDSVFGGTSDAGVAKFDTTLAGESSLVYSTYLGGSAWDHAEGLDIDSDGNVYVVGATASTDYPTTADGNDRVRSGDWDGFLTILNAAGTDLVYSTYLGGSTDDRAENVTVDSFGAAYVVGWTATHETWGSTEPTNLSSATVADTDVFVAKIMLNQVPTAVDDGPYVVAEDGTLNVLVGTGVLNNDTDPETDPLTATVFTDVSHGTLTLSTDGAFDYTPEIGFASTDTFVYLADDGNGGTDTAIATITVTPNGTNDTPVNDVPGAQEAVINTALVFNDANGNRIVVHDDAGANDIEVALTATNGTLTLSGTSGLGFTDGDGTADTNMTFTGTLAEINTALDGLTFDPTSAYAGAASVRIETDDQGYTGGGTLMDDDTINIDVQPLAVNSTTDVSDAPDLSTIAALIGNPGADGFISLREAITAANADGGTDKINFNIPVTDARHFYYQDDGMADSLSKVATTSDDASITDFDDDYSAGMTRSWYSIQLGATELTIITDSVILDGTTQAGYITGAPVIEIDASNVTSGDGNAITLQAGSSEICGLVINGAGGDGIEIETNGGNTIAGNTIGTDVTGTVALGNQGHGIEITDGASNNTLGGTEDGVGNLIAYSGLDGIEISSSAGSGNEILGNAIYSNGGLGIDLVNDGVTANDTDDVDSGVNGLQNFPVLYSANIAGDSVSIVGTLNSIASTTYRIEFFASSTAEASGYGEGERYLGYADVATDINGDASFSADFSVTIAAGEYITGTATDPNGNTSEFSNQTAAHSAMAVWSDISTTPLSSLWDGADFGTSAGTTALTDRYSIMQAAVSALRNEAIVVGIDASGNVTGEMWDGMSWSALSLNPMGTTSVTYYWSADVAYEVNSGDAILVWDDNPDLKYSVWNGSSWSAAATIAAYTGAEPQQMHLAAAPNSDEMVLVVGDSANVLHALAWDGSNWGNAQALDTSGKRTSVEVAYEHQSGDAVVVYGKGSNDTGDDLYYRIWDGSSWTGENTYAPPTVANRNAWSVVAADPNSDRIALGGHSTSGEVWFSVWDGGAWTATTEVANDSDYSSPNVALAFESLSGDLLATYSKSWSSTTYYRTWSAGGGWSGEGSVSATSVSEVNSTILAADPASDEIMLLVQDDDSDLNAILWDGSTWGAAEEIEDDTGEIDNQPFVFLWNVKNRPPVAADDAYGVAADGTLNVAVGTGVLANDTDPDTDPLTASLVTDVLHGTLVLNADGSFDYTPYTGFASTDTFTYYASDGRGGTDTATVTITVTPDGTNDAPVNDVPGAQEAGEDTSLVFNDANGNRIVVHDDPGANDIKVTLTATNGTLTLSSISGLIFTDGDGTADVSMTFTGTLAEINAAIDGLTFDPTSAYTGAASVQIETDDQGYTGGGVLTDDDTINIDVVQVNEAPVNTVPGAQTIDGDGVLLFSSATSTQLVISDSDAASSPVKVTLSATNGTINLPGTQGLSFSVGDGTADSSMTFTGTITDINAALAGVTFAATPGFTGAASLQIITSDQGYTGYGGALSDTDTVAITVQVMYQSLWVSTTADVSSPSGAPGLDAWTSGEVLQFGDPDLAFEAGTTDGTFSSVFNLDTFASDTSVIIDAIHYVGRDIQVGAVTPLQLYAGDVILSTEDNYTFTSTNSLAIARDDAFVFRPDTQGDYSSGTFILLIDKSAGGLDSRISGLTLIEQDTDVGDATLDAGDFLYIGENSKTVSRWQPDAMGVATAGTETLLFIDGADIDIGQNITAIDMIEEVTTIGDVTLTSGQILLSLMADDSAVGDGTTIATLEEDIFILDITTTGASTVGTATRFFEGLDVGLNSANEDLWALSLRPNDPPVISNQSLPNLAENSANTTVVGTVSATDPDASDTLSYAIIGGNTGTAFVINATTGQITVANTTALDFETTPTFNLTVAAIDDAGASDTATITINLTDVNDNTPVITASQSFNVAEDAADSDSVGTVLATDADTTGSLQSWTITAGNTGSIFGINGTSGEITVADNSNLDRETTASYVLTLTVGDGVNTSSSETVTVTITDVNDNAPVITTAQIFNVSEDAVDTTSVGTVVATDADTTGSLQSWTITAGNGDAIFAINGTSGEITVADNSNLDRETTASYVLTLTVGDGVNTSSSETVTINVTDVNEYDPVVNDQGFNVDENSANATVVGTVAASDADTSQTLTYTITAGNPNDAFAINSSTGAITVNDVNELDHETTPSYALMVEVTDSLAPTRSDTATITITVNDVNESDPVVTDQSFAIDENSANGTSVNTVAASDADTSQTFTYVITVGNTNTAFAMNNATGEISVADVNELDHETTSSYSLTVQVTDSLAPTRNNTATITIDVNDVNEYDPVVNDQGFNVDENSANATSVGTVTASDADTSQILTYTITAGNTNDAFAINSSTGEITVNNVNQLDHETTSQYSLTVDVTDSLAPIRNDTATVTIDVNDVNEYDPVANRASTLMRTRPTPQ